MARLLDFFGSLMLVGLLPCVGPLDRVGFRALHWPACEAWFSVVMWLAFWSGFLSGWWLAKLVWFS
jgi:hypothetical protein